MAEVKVSIEMLNRLLFTEDLVDIVGVSYFDKDTDVIAFEIEGAIVPEVKQVRVEVTEYHRKVKFVPVLDEKECP